MIYPGAPYWFGPRALNSYKPFPIPREITARITIPPDMPAGVIRWQVANANGASEPAEFVISRDTPEVSEETLPQEGSARRLPSLPLTINGRLEKKEEVDRYLFTAEHTGPVTCELPTQTIGFPVQAAIQIADDAGRNIVDQVDTAGSGSQLTFAVTKGKRYTLTLHDLDYRGNRRDGLPAVAASRPTGGRDDADPCAAEHGNRSHLGRLRNRHRETGAWRRSSKRSPAERNRFGIQFKPNTDRRVSSRSKFLRFAENVVSTASGQQAIPLTLPTCICGVFDDPRGWNVYKFDGQKGDVWSIDLSSRTNSRNLDVMFSLHDADGRGIATSDDAAGTLSCPSIRDDSRRWSVSPAGRRSSVCGGQHRCGLSALHR